MSTDLEVANPNRLSLFVLTEAIVTLMEAIDEAPDELARETVSQELRHYVEQEVRKVDSIRAYYKHCEFMASAARQEAAEQAKRSQAWAARADRLKHMVYDVMTTFGMKKLEGRSGVLMVKGNGGRQLVKVDNPELLDPKYLDYAGVINGAVWERLKRECPWLVQESTDAVRIGAAPSLTRIGEALQDGPVAGARLEDRGSHAEIK